MVNRRIPLRRAVLSVALVGASALLILDRTAAYIHRPAEDSTAVVIYTAEWCPYCRLLRSYLEEHQVPYTDYDVEKTVRGAMGFWALRGTGVPISAVGPDVVYGYDLQKIETSLGRLGYRNRFSLEGPPEGYGIEPGR